MLHVDRHGQQGAPRVVLVHGFTQTRESWRRLVPALAGQFEVLAVDAPAHGRSSHHRVGLWEGAKLLAEACGQGTYVGYSMGGRLALHLAISDPSLVHRLVLIGATGGIDDPDERAARRAADDELADDLERDGLDAFLEGWLANPLFATLPDDAADREARRANTAEALAASLRQMGTGQQEPLWDRLGYLRMPILVLAGERDEKFTALAYRIQTAWGGPAQVTIIPEAGHAAHLERPDAVLAAVLPFVRADTEAN